MNHIYGAQKNEQFILICAKSLQAFESSQMLADKILNNVPTSPKIPIPIEPSPTKPKQYIPPTWNTYQRAEEHVINITLYVIFKLHVSSQINTITYNYKVVNIQQHIMVLVNHQH